MTDWADDLVPAAESPADLDDRAPAAFGVNVDALVSQLVETAMQAIVRKEVAGAAAAAVDDALDEDRRAALRMRAEAAAEAAVAEQLQDEAAQTDEPQLFYGSTDEFVREWLIHAYKRRVGGEHMLWAANWWEYPEAIMRLEALWRSWEHLRLDPATGMSVWWRDHADHHMRVLFSADGPFKGRVDSEENRNKAGEPLPYAAPPAGMFPDVREPPPDLPPGYGLDA